MPITTIPYGFIPTQVSNCSLWLDAADSSTVTLSGSTATQWNDKSGNGRNSTSCSATYSNRINGLSCMTNPVISGPIANSGSSIVTIFIVGTKASTGSFYDSMLSLNLSPITNYYGAGTLFACYYGGTSPPQFYCYMSGNLSLSFVGAVNTPFIFNAFQTGTTGSTYGNGTSYGDVGTAGSTFNYTTYYIGTCTGGPAWIGNICEIIVYNSILSISQRQQVESYLAQKWGVKLSLAGHPGLTSTVYQSTYLKTAGPKRNIATMTSFYTAFSPRQIGGCALWLDGADPAGTGVAPTSGATITSWKDKSGSANHFGTTSGTTTNILDNGKFGVNFPFGAVMTSANQITFTTSSQIFIVCKLLDPTGFAMILAFPNATGISGVGDFSMRFNGGVLVGTGSGDGNDVGNLTYYVNGNFNPNYTSSTYYNTYCMIDTAIRTGGTSYITLSSLLYSRSYTGYINEFLYFPAGITSTQRQQVESYLAQKWGLTSSLPGAHLNATQPAGAVTTLSLANSKISITSKRITAFTSFRWTITAGNTDQFVQFSEFQVGYNNSQVVFVSPTTATTGSTISWNTGNGEGPVQVVDNNLGTKGLGIGTSGLILIVTVATPITANMYRWASANDSTPSRNPTQWTVDGSADGTTYVRLHTQNTTYAGPNTTFTYTSWINFTY
jgi:hypothetical protein